MNYLLQDNPYVEAYGSTPYLPEPSMIPGSLGSLGEEKSLGLPDWAIGPAAAAVAYVLKSGKFDVRGLAVFGLVGLGMQALARKLLSEDKTIVGVSVGAAAWYFYDYTGIEELSGEFRLPGLKGLFKRSRGGGSPPAEPGSAERSLVEQLMEESQGTLMKVQKLDSAVTSLAAQLQNKGLVRMPKSLVGDE